MTAQEQKPFTMEGHTFEPWQDGLSTGFKVTHHDGRVEYMFLCPTTVHHPGGGADAAMTVIIHRGPSQPDKKPGPNPDDDPDLDGGYRDDALIAKFDLFLADE